MLIGRYFGWSVWPRSDEQGGIHIMRVRNFLAPFGNVLFAALFALWLTTSALAQQEKILYTFDGTHGRDPSAGLIFDASGNLYGTTTYGGTTD
jgi:hypothetical protein